MKSPTLKLLKSFLFKAENGRMIRVSAMTRATYFPWWHSIWCNPPDWSMNFLCTNDVQTWVSLRQLMLGNFQLMLSSHFTGGGGVVSWNAFNFVTKCFAFSFFDKGQCPVTLTLHETNLHASENTRIVLASETIPSHNAPRPVRFLISAENLNMIIGMPYCNNWMYHAISHAKNQQNWNQGIWNYENCLDKMEQNGAESNYLILEMHVWLVLLVWFRCAMFCFLFDISFFKANNKTT